MERNNSWQLVWRRVSGPRIRYSGCCTGRLDPNLVRDDVRAYVQRPTALAILTAVTAGMPAQHNDDLIALTVPEIRRLINTLILARPPDILLTLHWSTWRRRHQARARTSHHQRQQRQEPNLKTDLQLP